MRPRVRVRRSSTSTIAVSATSTSASTAAGVRSKSAPVLEVDRARERVVPHQRDDAEVGERVERDEQRRRAPSAGGSQGSVTRKKPLAPETPRPRAASSSAGSRSRSAARASRKTYGYVESVEADQRARVARRVGQPLDAEAPAAAAPSRRRSRAGRTRRRSSGSRAAARRRRPRDRAPGRSVRVTSQASGTPTDERRRDDADDEQHGVDRRARQRAGLQQHARGCPLPPLATRITRYASGSRSSETITPATTASGSGGRRVTDVRPPARALTSSQPVSRSSSSVASSSAPNAVRSTSGPVSDVERRQALLRRRCRRRAGTRPPRPPRCRSAAARRRAGSRRTARAASAFVGAREHAGAGDADERAGIVARQEVVRDRRVGLLLLDEVEVVVVDEPELDLAGRDGLDDRRVLLVGFGVVRLQALEPLAASRPRRRSSRIAVTNAWNDAFVGAMPTLPFQRSGR